VTVLAALVGFTFGVSTEVNTDAKPEDASLKSDGAIGDANRNYDSRYNNRYDGKYNDRYNKNYDNRYNNRYDDRYNDRYNKVRKPEKVARALQLTVMLKEL